MRIRGSPNRPFFGTPRTRRSADLARLWRVIRPDLPRGASWAFSSDFHGMGVLRVALATIRPITVAKPTSRYQSGPAAPGDPPEATFRVADDPPRSSGHPLQCVGRFLNQVNSGTRRTPLSGHATLWAGVFRGQILPALAIACILVTAPGCGWRAKPRTSLSVIPQRSAARPPTCTRAWPHPTLSWAR